MGRSTTSGPFAGAYQTTSFRHTLVISVEQAIAVLTAPQDLRVVAVRVRLINVAAGTLTAHKVRRAAAGNTVVTAAGTQMLSADGGAIAANAQNAIEPTVTTPTLLAAQRNFTKGQQLGVFGTCDGTTNTAVVDIVWFPLDVGGTGYGQHVLASEAND